MLDILEKYLSDSVNNGGCAVSHWIAKQPADVQEVFQKLRENKSANLAALYAELHSEAALPFKISVFRAHMKEYCACR